LVIFFANSAKTIKQMKIRVELGGGLEIVFENKRDFEVEMPGDKATVKDLVDFLAKNNLRGNADHFLDKGHLRAGILVLVNDCDWSLSGEEESPIENKDKVSFISTLHGG
jgi:ubiquitin related modifier 1